MLNPSDVYVEGGTDDLLVCWTKNVTKYDASSFYNWEMDNLPLHDLEERTHLLWERLGHPTSAITGMSFIVSGDATSSCNPLYFVDLSSCLAALPEVINCPILIEVASFGNLGSLELSNKVFGPRGALEIVNRNCAFAPVIDLDNEQMSVERISSNSNSTLGFGLAEYVSSLHVNGETSPVSCPGVSFDAYNSYMYTNGQKTSSAVDTALFADVRWQPSPAGNQGTSLCRPYVFTRKVGENQAGGVLTGSVSSNVGGGPFNTASNWQAAKFLRFDTYDEDKRTAGGDDMNIYDASTINEITNNVIWPVTGATNESSAKNAAASFAYFNHLNFIKVKNCNGPVYIRNFAVDGARTREKGIEITDSTVYLERCSASRCTQAGLFVSNSNVKLLRGFVAFRNYGFDGGSRVGIPWKSKITSYDTLESYGAGIYAENSTIDVKSTYARDMQKSSEASSLVYKVADYGDGGARNLPCPEQEALYCLSRNDIGIHAVNSNITGGRTELNGSGSLSWQDATQLFVELNTEAGARLDNCNLNLKGRFLAYGNYFGIDALNSKLSFDFFKGYANQKDAMKLDGCSLVYNNNTYSGFLGAANYDSARTEYLQHQVTFLLNGGAIHAKNSTIEPVYVSSMPDIYQSFFVSGTHGVYKDSVGSTRNAKPAIRLEGTKLDAIHAAIYTEGNGDRFEPCFGEAIAAEDGSQVFLRGSKQFANKIFGGNSNTAQHKRAALYAGNNSKISLQGPTVVAQFGVDALIDNNSELEICPLRDSEGTLLASSFALSDPGNHTKVELHSTRACIVADNNSVVNIEDLGSYRNLWPGQTYGDGLDLSRFDYLQTGDTATVPYTSQVSGGYLQLYPNGYVQTGEDFFSVNPGVSRRNFQNTTWPPIDQYYLYAVQDNGGDFGISAVTTGGMSVRALNQSEINVLNTHFPAGFAQSSSIIYDFSGVDGLEEACTRFPIWNIADDSLLRASYLSVSGQHPQDAGYVGPSGSWFGASSAPSTTPDTSSLSLLDFYGPGPNNQNLFSKGAIRNFGPFRLYFSVDPLANYLVDPNNGVSGYATQVFSQGYHFSGSLSSPGDVSAFYVKALFQDPDTLVVSDTGFHYAGDIVHSPKTIKAFLDDSAANTFANAKHNSVGKSNLATVVAIYDPYDKGFGGDSLSDKDKGRGVASVNNFDLKKSN